MDSSRGVKNARRANESIFIIFSVYCYLQVRMSGTDIVSIAENNDKNVVA